MLKSCEERKMRLKFSAIDICFIKVYGTSFGKKTK